MNITIQQDPIKQHQEYTKAVSPLIDMMVSIYARALPHQILITKGEAEISYNFSTEQKEVLAQINKMIEEVQKRIFGTPRTTQKSGEQYD